METEPEPVLVYVPIENAKLDLLLRIGESWQSDETQIGSVPAIFPTFVGFRKPAQPVHRYPQSIREDLVREHLVAR